MELFDPEKPGYNPPSVEHGMLLRPLSIENLVGGFNPFEKY